MDLQGVSEFWIMSRVFINSISWHQEFFFNVEVDSFDPERETNNVTGEHNLIM